MPRRPGRQGRPQGHAPTIRTSINLTRTSWDTAETIAASLGISRDALIDEMLAWQGTQLDARNRPKWWTRRRAPKWWIDPDPQKKRPMVVAHEEESPLTKSA